MGIFNMFPFTNFHELNLDWILAQIKDIRERLDQIDPGSGDSKFTFLSKLGADPEGRTDCTDILLDYFSILDPYAPELLIVDGEFLIAGDLGETPRNLTVLFLDGAFDIGANASVYWKSDILNTDGEIFKGSLSNLVCYGITLRPEYFGAVCDGQTESGPAINQAIQCARHCDIVLKSGTKNRSSSGLWTPTVNCYVISIPILVNKEYVALRGEEPNAVICSKTLTNLIQIGSGLTNSRIERCRLENIEAVVCHDNIGSNDTAAASSYTVSVIGLESGLIYNVRCIGNPNGFYITQTSGNKFEKCTVNTAPPASAVITSGRMFYINANYRNTSDIFEDCGGSNGIQILAQTGLHIEGSASVRDLFIRHMEFTAVGNGIVITATGSASGNNILFENAILDQIAGFAILIDGSLPRQFVRFVNSYIWRSAGSAEAVRFAPTGTNCELVLDNCEFNDDVKSQPTIEATTGHMIITNAFFRNCGNSIHLSGRAVANVANSNFTDTVTTAIDWFIKNESTNAGSRIQSCYFNNVSGLSAVNDAAIVLTAGNTAIVFNEFYGYIATYLSGEAYSSIVINRQTASQNKATGFVTQ